MESATNHISSGDLSIKEVVVDDKRELNPNEDGEEKASKLPQVRCAIAASLGSFMLGNIYGWSGAALTKMDTDFEMDDTKTSLVASTFTYGTLLGCLLAGYLLDSLGRRRAMVAVTPSAVLGYVLIGTAQCIYSVYMGRFLCGLVDGLLYSSSTLYVVETCQSSLRGRLGCLNVLSISCGVLASYFLAGFFTWRTSALLCIIPAAIFFIAMYLAPETPYWYLLKGNYEAASSTLKLLRGSKCKIDNELKEMIKKIESLGESSGYKELLKRRTLHPMAISLFLQTMAVFAGGFLITVYASTIFKDAHSYIDEENATICLGIAPIIGSLMSIYLIERLGRRLLLVASLSLVSAFVLNLGVYFLKLKTENPWSGWMPLILMFGIMTSFSFGCRIVPSLVAGEIFNTSVRSQANTLSVFYKYVLYVIIIQVYPFLVSSIGYPAIFFAIGVFCICSTVGILLFVPETKGKTLEEIQDFFEQKASTNYD